MKQLYPLIFILVIALLGGCKEGELLKTGAPSTTLYVDTIALSDNERLPSRVLLRWQGFSSDDYVVGYKVLFSFSPIPNTAAAFDTVKSVTTKTDSTFQFVIPRGSNNADVYFSVQAINSKGIADNNPPVLKVPIINTPPTSRWDDAKLPKANQVLAVVTLPFNVDDFDGKNTLDSVQIRANFGEWITIPTSTTQIALVAQNPKQSGTQSALIYNTTFERGPLSIRLPNFRNNDSNSFEIRAIDASGATSKSDTTKSIFVTAQRGDLLVLEGHYSDSLLPFYKTQVFANSSVAPDGVDFITFAQNDELDQPQVLDPTLDLLFSLYKSIYFYNDVRNSGDDPYLLESYYPYFRNYLRNNGKLILSCPFPKAVEALSSNSPVFSLIPVSTQGFGTTAFQVSVARLNNNRAVNPAARATGFPALTSNFAFASIDPFNITPDGDSLYSAPNIFYTPANPSASQIIAARKKNAQGKTNLVYFSVELHKLNGNNQNLQQLFTHILNNEFNW